MDKTHEQQRQFSLDLMHDLKEAYDDALVCFYAHDNKGQANHKHEALLERLETIKTKFEEYKR